MATIPKSIEFHASSLMKNVTLNVKIAGYRRWRVRVRIGLVLIRFAAWIMGMGSEVEPSCECSPNH